LLIETTRASRQRPLASLSFVCGDNNNNCGWLNTNRQTPKSVSSAPQKRVRDYPYWKLSIFHASSNRVLVDLKAKETDRLNGVGSAAPPAAKPISVALATTSITDLQSEMDAKGLGDASRVRRLVDLHCITDSQITVMKADDRDRSKILLKSNMI
jgi:hypothetical protein